MRINETTGKTQEPTLDYVLQRVHGNTQKAVSEKDDSTASGKKGELIPYAEVLKKLA